MKGRVRFPDALKIGAFPTEKVHLMSISSQKVYLCTDYSILPSIMLICVVRNKYNKLASVDGRLPFAVWRVFAK